MLTKAKSLLILLACMVQQVFSQNVTRSPYSALGLGDVQFTGSAWMSAMGQVSQGFSSPYLINNQNPASYSALRYTIFDVAAKGSSINLKTTNGSSHANTSAYSYFAMAFPLSQKLGLGASLGFMPFSGTGYNITRSIPLANVNGTEYLKGTGGLSKFYVGSGIRVYKNLSAGVNAAYLFGSNNNTNFLQIQISDTMFNLLETRRRYIGDFQFDIGLQYTDSFYIKKDSSRYQWTAGVTVSPERQLSAFDDYSVRTMSIGSVSPNVGGGLGKDTVVNKVNSAGRITLPMVIKGGFFLQKIDAWSIGVDVGYYNWANYRAFGTRDSLKNTLSIGAGGSFIPNANALKGYFNHVEYRAGIRYDNGNINVKGSNINTIGISAGVGLPLGRYKTKLNITGEYITRGTTSNNLVRENYMTLTVGVIICDKWFHRYRYD